MREEAPAPSTAAAPGTAPQNAPGTPAAPALPAVKPFDRKRAEAGARMAVSALNVAQAVPMRMLANRRMNKLEQRYVPEEADRKLAAQQLIANTLPTTEEEKRNQNYMNKLVNKRMQLYNQIELSEQSKTDLTRCITDYEEVTGKTLSPELMLLASIMGIVGGNCYRIFTTDINIAE